MKKWKAMSYSWMRKYTIIKTPILSKLIYKLNSIPNRIQQEITRGNWITRASHSYKNLNQVPVFYHMQNYNLNGLNVDEIYKNLGRNSKNCVYCLEVGRTLLFKEGNAEAINKKIYIFDKQKFKTFWQIINKKLQTTNLEKCCYKLTRKRQPNRRMSKEYN